VALPGPDRSKDQSAPATQQILVGAGNSRVRRVTDARSGSAAHASHGSDAIGEPDSSFSGELRSLAFGPEVAPRLREMTNPQRPADFLRGHADPFGKGGERELEFGDLLHGHARGHGSSNRLNGLR